MAVRRHPGVRFVALLSALALMAVVAACGDDDTDSSSSSESGSEGAEGAEASDELIPLKVSRSDPMWLEASFQLIADEFGWYEEAGIDPEWITASTSGTMAQVFAAGELEVCYCGFGQSVELAGLGNGKIISIPIKNYTYQLIAGGDSGVEEIEDLEGHTIGVSAPGGASETHLLVAFARAGGDPSKVQSVAIGGATERTAALLNGSIDATLQIYWQVAQILRDNPDLHVVVDDMQEYLADGYSTTVYVASNPAIEDKGEAIEAFLGVNARAVRWIVENPEEAAQMVIDNDWLPGIEAEFVEEGFQRAVDADIWPLDQELTEEEYDLTMDELLEYTPDQFSAEHSYEDVVDPSFNEAALEEVGRA